MHLLLSLSLFCALLLGSKNMALLFFANILKYCIVCSWGAAGLIVFGLENNNTVFDSSLSHLVEAQLGRKLYFVYKIFTIFGPFQREFRAV